MKKLIPILLLIFASLQKEVMGQTYRLNDSMETGHFNRKYPNGTDVFLSGDGSMCNPPTDSLVDNTRAHSGTRSLRFLCRYDFNNCQGSPRSDKKFLNGSPYPGKDDTTLRWADMWVYLDSSYAIPDPIPDLWFQIHNRDEGADTVYKVVLMGHWVNNGVYQVPLQFYPNGPNKSLPQNGPTKVTGDSATVSSNPATRARWLVANDVNKWTHWTYHWKFSVGADGMWEVYKNDQLFWRYLGPNYNLNMASWYLKLGIYKWNWKLKTVGTPTVARRVVWIDDLKLGTSSNVLADFINVPKLSNKIVATNPVCNGYLGTATVVDSGGTGPIQHFWSNGATSSSINVSAGTYSCISVDYNGKKDTAFVTLTQPNAVNASASVGTLVGSFAPITVTASGGTSPYAITGGADIKTTNPAIFSSPIGENTFTVIDSKGCQKQIIAIVNGPTPDTTKPTAPASLSASNITYYGVTLSWNASTDNRAVAGYNLYRDNVLVATLTGTTFNDGSLLENSSYTYKVNAFDAAGNTSGFSSTITFSTPLSPDVVSPSVPLIISATGVSQTQATINWDASIDNRGVTAYKVYRGGALIATLGNVLSYTNTGLAASVTYSYQVQALDAAGNASGLSSSYSLTTLANPDITAPSKPAGLAATNVTQTQATISWAPSTDNVGVAGYFLYRDNTLLATLGNVTTFTNTGLTASTSYTYAVEAFDVAGNISATSTPLSVTTLSAPDLTAPSTPTAPVFVSSTENAITVSWTAATDNVGVAGYKVYRNGVLVATLGNVLSYTFVGLSVNTGYSLAVQAYDASGNNSSISTAIVVTTPDRTAPSAPSNVRAINITKTTATLTWTKSTDNVATIGYYIYKNGVQIASVGDISTFNITGLVTGTKYKYSIAAFDGAGNVSNQSIAITFSTLGRKTTAKVVVGL